MAEHNNVVKRYHAVMTRIDAACKDVGRDPKSVRLVGVTKTVDVPVVNAVLKEGLSLIGENRVQEMLGKYDAYRLDGVEVHFIGTLQKNKVRYLIDKVDMIESVDSLSLALEIDKRAAKTDKVMPILVQVNIDDEHTKSGVTPQEVLPLMRELAKLRWIRVKGLMCIPDPDKTPESFARMQALFEMIKNEKIPGIEMEELSMGMSGDYTEAIRYGATLVRVGRGIFGERSYNVTPQTDGQN